MRCASRQVGRECVQVCSQPHTDPEITARDRQKGKKLVDRREGKSNKGEDMWVGIKLEEGQMFEVDRFVC